MNKLKRTNHFRYSQRKPTAPFFSVLLMFSALVAASVTHASDHTSGLETATVKVETLSREFRLDGAVEGVEERMHTWVVAERPARLGLALGAIASRDLGGRLRLAFAQLDVRGHGAAQVARQRLAEPRGPVANREGPVFR